MQKNNFLIEIHTEELPPKSLHSLANHFFNGIQTHLQKSGLEFSKAHFFATPRRLAVLVNELSSQQADKVIERKGPALDKAYDADGNPTPACIGFARSCGIEAKDLITLPGNFVGCQQQVKGKTTTELLPALVDEVINALPIPKPMRWGNYTHKFIRPVRSVIMLYGNNIVDAEILGCKTSNKTQGHRFLANDAWMEIKTPESYADTLKNAFVIADFAERKQKIAEQITACVTNALGDGASAIVENELLDEVTSLVEWPEALCGSFDKAFLSVPQEALISSMKEHQRYFPVVDKNHKLLPNFITISNIQSKNGQRIIAGNERVLRARLSDAAFFFETDKKVTLESRTERLKTIIFQNKLGTLFDKTERVKKIAAHIAKQLNENIQDAERAAFLSKTDLTAELVGEFPEIQGIAGSYYALHDGEKETVAQALSEQYKPRFSGDTLPQSNLGCILALADRLDTLVGVFGINLAPTGDKDPFGLRRAALGLLRILIEKKLNLDLQELITFSALQFPSLENKNVVTDTANFILERLKPWYQEQDVSAQVIASVMSLNFSKPYDIHCRIQAVMNFKNRPEAEALSTANKRVSNILSKNIDAISATQIDPSLFESNAEKDLAEKLTEQEKTISQFSNTAQYQEVLSQLASLREPVDNFFDNVMVMAEDKARRENRLLMLKKLRELFLNVADIALLQ